MSNLEGITLQKRYNLRQLVGSGGMADVYLAWDKTRSTKMAIKILRRDLESNGSQFQNFAKEAELLRRLEHPYIVRLYEFNREGDLFFLVMDWVDGTNLRQAIMERGQPFPLGEVSRIIQPICSALNYAHQNSVFHCDIKPANILMHADGRVLLSDFGVARLASEKKEGGTPTYMAPEQIMVQSVAASTDVYALGITIYEMLSGQVPFRGASPNSKGTTVRERVEWEHCNLPLPPLELFNLKLNKDVIRVIQKALNKNPKRRYPSILDLRDDFEHARSLKEDRGTMTETILETSRLEPKFESIQEVNKKILESLPSSKHPYLFGRSGIYLGQIIPIQKRGLTIGRGSHNHLRLNEQSVSRKHASILRTQRAVYIRDENSLMGTYVNNKRVSGPVRLVHGDIIRLGGDQVFEFLGK